MNADDHTRDTLALLHTPGIGPATHLALQERFGDATAVLAAMGAELEAAGLTAQSRSYLADINWQNIDADLAWLDQPGRHLITPASEHFPALLEGITPALFVHGDPALLRAPQLAMVGSRNPTAGGKDTARAFAGFLADCGLTITSGLATGIDTASHRGALDAGGTTIAVCGTGLDRVYPSANRDLAREIADRGALVSEFVAGTPPRKEHFPQRNRIISGLSLGVLVVEAAHRSGSLITAHQAIEQGREVFAIPGSIHNPLARGCHRLIREGAKLVEAAPDILEELGALANVANSVQKVSITVPAESSRETDPDYRRLLDSLGFDPIPVDTLVERTGLTAEAVSSMLLILELEGQVKSAPGGAFFRVTPG
ncbi:MAG: DNA-processing protein DprA [Pseudomonadota bacterium]